MKPDRLPFGHAYLPRVPVPEDAAHQPACEQADDGAAGIVIRAERRFVRVVLPSPMPTGRSAA